MGRILVVVANSRHWEIHGKFMVSSLQLTAQSGSQIPKTVLIIEQDTFSGSCDRFCCCFLLLLLFFFFYEEGAESFMYIHCRTGCVTVLSLNLVDIFTLK